MVLFGFDLAYRDLDRGFIFLWLGISWQGKWFSLALAGNIMTRLVFFFGFG